MTLHVGDTGAYVRSVQQKLSNLGYWLGTPDGQYGGLTAQSVMALQKAAGLGRDGVFGPATRRALEAGIRPQSRVGGRDRDRQGPPAPPRGPQRQGDDHHQHQHRER